MAAFAWPAGADPGFHGDGHHFAYGHAVSRLPAEHEVFVHGGVNYYYSHGWWYRGYGPHFVTIHPPFGLHVRILPDGCTTFVAAGVTYWVFNDIYYRQFGPDYVIVEPPVLESVPTATVVPSPPASPPQIAASDL
ncbi:MAG: hypothetical protein JO142_15810, partial [Burkholderiales bacterium]|nr:hypothetical protein [Burkholderiales bacterium]